MFITFILLGTWRASISKPPDQALFWAWAFAGLVVAAITHIPVVLSDAALPVRSKHRRTVRVAGLVGTGGRLAQAGVFSVVTWAGYDLSDRAIDEWAFTVSGAIWGVWLIVAGVIVWKRSLTAALGAVIAGMIQIFPVLPGESGLPEHPLPLTLVGATGYAVWAVLVGRWSLDEREHDEDRDR
jgi:hypothetical protein